MKKSLLSLLITLAIAPLANCGIGGIPGDFTLNSVGPGKSSQSLRESTKTTRKHEGARSRKTQNGDFRRSRSLTSATTTNLNFNVIPNENQTP